MAWTAATAEDSARTMKTGSMRMEPKAMWEEERVVGANRLEHSDWWGTMER